MKVLQAGMAECQTSREPAILVALGLGSCVGVCMYDRNTKIAGLVHIMLPDSSMARGVPQPFKYADTGVPMMVDIMRKAGADIRNIVVKIAGGAQMFRVLGNSMNIGERNVEAVKKVLKSLGMRISAEEVGGKLGRTVKLDSTTGLVTVKTIGSGEKEL